MSTLMRTILILFAVAVVLRLVGIEWGDVPGDLLLAITISWNRTLSARPCVVSGHRRPPDLQLQVRRLSSRGLPMGSFEVGRELGNGDVGVPSDLARGVTELARGELGRRRLGDQRRRCALRVAKTASFPPRWVAPSWWHPASTVEGTDERTAGTTAATAVRTVATDAARPFHDENHDVRIRLRPWACTLLRNRRAKSAGTLGHAARVLRPSGSDTALCDTWRCRACNQIWGAGRSRRQKGASDGAERV